MTVGTTVYDPSCGTGPFPDHAAWEKVSLAGVATDITDAEGKKAGSGKIRREVTLSYMQRLLPPD